MSIRVRKAFLAFPDAPVDLTGTLKRAVTLASGKKDFPSITAWPSMPSFGANIPDQIRKQIREADVLVCDVTRPNMNVYYEAGYAIGSGKSLAPIVNVSFAEATSELQRDGLFDNIGYMGYENSEQLVDNLSSLPANSLSSLYGKPVNFQQPLYILDSYRKTDYRNSIVSAVKAANVFYRSFDPAEVPRFSTVSIIAEATASAGIIIPLLPPHLDDAPRHNLRAALLAGLCHGLNRQTLLLEQLRPDANDPADYRQMVTFVRDEAEIEKIVSEFAKSALVGAQSIDQPGSKAPKTDLQRLSLGASAAENEFRTLGSYFVETAEFLRTLRGEINVVAGRKGSGKTAIFFQIRDSFRQNKQSLVVDLKPESHQLSLFREEMLRVVDVGVFDHTLAAFWYFVILTEVLLAMRKQFEYEGRFNGDSLNKADAIRSLLSQFDVQETGDFTSRITRLGVFVVQEIRRITAKSQKPSADQLTNIVFRHGISQMKTAIQNYTDTHTEIVFLFDNIDKGWPANGVHEFDVRMVRLLVEALDKIKRDFHVQHREFLPVVFLRNDIYELMVEATPDRGKAGQVLIDWNDRAKLRQVIYRRLQSSTGDKKSSFDNLWLRFFTPTVDGLPTFDYFVDHSLMRPRFLINILENAIANAINRAHTIVDEQDCQDAVEQHSNYLVNDFGYEIRDVSGVRADILYSLIGAPRLCTKDEILQRFIGHGLDPTEADRAFALLLWYGVLGLMGRGDERLFIYDFGYDMRRLEAEIRMMGGNDLYIMNSAFRFH